MLNGRCFCRAVSVPIFSPGLHLRRLTSELSECVGVLRDILACTADGVEATTEYEDVTALADRQGLG